MDFITSTLAAIDAAIEKEGNKDKGHRAHLGASLIGDPCERKLWYTFRWATDVHFDGRLLRLFGRGHREEATFIELLKLAGVEVYDCDPKNPGRQFTFSEHGGHFGGSIDGIGRNFVEDAKNWHVLEFKTSSAKAFKDVQAKGVKEAKPLHYAQMQCYMTWTNTERAFYMVVNKDNDDIYTEIVRRDSAESKALFEKAGRIIASDKPPARMTDDPTYYLCKFCEHSETCHGNQVAAVSCRTCIHATPELDGKGRWSCARHGKDISTDEQREACPDHRFIPALVPFGEAIKADEKGDTITYQTADGSVFHNGPRGACSYPSAELVNVTPAHVSNGDVDYIRNTYDAWTVKP